MARICIRKSIFESNSSSMHAMTIPNEKVESGINLEKVKWKFDLDKYDSEEFDWNSGSDLESPKDKIYYFWVAIIQNQEWGKEWAYDAEKTLKEWLPRCTFVDPEERCDEWGYCKWSINHQSNDVEFVKMCMSDKSLFDELMLSGTIHLWSDETFRPNVSEYSKVILYNGEDVKDKWEKKE